MEATKRLPLSYTLLGVTLVPVYLLCLGLAIIARALVRVHLSWTEPRYRGLLNFFDLFFDRDSHEARSNITVLSMGKLASCETAKDLRDKMIKRAKIVLRKENCVKLKCIIKEWRGFRYWQEATIDVEEQVKTFKASSLKEVQSFLSHVSNQQITGEKMWELYIGDHLIENQYPMIFKAHHSVADGYGIRNMIVDSQGVDSSVTRKPLEKQIREIKSFAVNTLNLMLMILCAPILCVSQCLSPKDQNSFRAKKLSSEKQISWEKADFQKIKEIQKRTGYSFSEVILTAVSKALDDVLAGRGERVPRVTLIFPHRRSRASRGLENEFVLAPIQLPISTEQREEDVAAACRSLDTVPSYRLNYFAPRFACFPFPAPLPRWALESTEFTVLVSNFPGPSEKLVFDGFEVESACFVVPNIVENNGLGITMVSYNGQYSVACILDKAVARTPNDSDQITQAIVKYIDDTHSKLYSENKN